MTPAKIEELKRLAKAATPGPFQFQEDGAQNPSLWWRNPFGSESHEVIARYYWPGHPVEETAKVEEWWENLGLLHAQLDPQTVLALCDEVERLRTALSFYADEKSWKHSYGPLDGPWDPSSPVDDDEGKRARAALKMESSNEPTAQEVEVCGFTHDEDGSFALLVKPDTVRVYAGMRMSEITRCPDALKGSEG